MCSHYLPPVSLSVFKSQAKRAVWQHKRADVKVCEFIANRHPEFAGLTTDEVAGRQFSLDDALLCVARHFGFPSWQKLEEHVGQLPATKSTEYERDEDFAHLVDSVQDLIFAIQEGGCEDVDKIIEANPYAAYPTWESNYEPSPNWYLECIPLCAVSKAVFEGKISIGTNEGAIANSLVAAGADTDICDGYPLVTAVSYNALDVVKALVDGGAAIDGVDGDGLPLAYPLLFGFTEIVEYLADQGARLDLRFAAGVGNLDRVKSFIGADGSLSEDAGTLADPYAYTPKREGKSPILAERTRQVILDQAFMFAAIHSRIEVAELLLDQGASINSTPPGFDIQATPLHRVVWFGNYGETVDVEKVIEPRRRIMAEFLLERGADVTIRDSVHNEDAKGWDMANLIGKFHDR